ncbi:MAG: M20/M25/M40 family metallo-hydrolase [Anaerolineae bacterium]|nr:M20/M25/M40 family metallo-hydrolase [Anaerolineae bacterium]
MKRHTSLLSLAFGLWMLFLLLACNLSNTSEPPTIAPRASSTPPPTISYATLSPEELPQVASTAVAGVPQVDANLLNLMNQIETDRLMLHVDTLQNFRTRHVNSVQNLPDQGIGAAYNYVMGQFEDIVTSSQARLTAFPQPFEVTWADVTSDQRNIVAFISGTEADAGVIVVGAHYDSISIDVEDGSAYAPGANDNASGIAALIEMARVLSTRQHHASIMFVAFAAEEINRQGSIAFVNNYLLPRDVDITAMINMDIIGSYYGQDGTVDDRNIRLYSAGPNNSPSRHLARTMELMALRHAPNMSIQIQDAVDRENRYGDHQSFSDAGIPAVRFIQPLEDYSRQHNDRDTIDGVQGVYLTRATQTILATITALADGPRPPENIALRDAGNGARTLIWEPVSGASGYIVGLRSSPNTLTYQSFEISEPGVNSVTWDRFTPEDFYSLAIAAKDSAGLMGPMSQEYIIR